MHRLIGCLPSIRILRTLGCLAGLALLSACAGHGVSPTQEAAEYKAHARHSYAPPGPPSDPWGPYIIEASQRFDVPDRWVREVMRVESGGHLYQGGDLITSWAGAMGLMQVMPETYDEMRSRYGLGDDAFDPHNNIMAGTAYIREMYDLYGSPGFLAAYNAGPKRLDAYLSNNRPLPDETRHYVAKIGPYIADSHPVNRSPAEGYAMNALPIDIPPGPRYGRSRYRQGVQMARSAPPAPPVPPRSFGSAPQYAQMAPPPPLPPSRHAGSGFRLIPSAMADTLPVRRGGPAEGHWAIQVGAFGNEAQARAAAGSAKEREALAQARTVVTPVQQGHARLYRARLAGLSHDAAIQACGRIGRGHSCMVLSPDAQS